MATIVETLSTLRTLTDQQKVAASLWESWIRLDIEARANLAGVPMSSLDPAQVDRFILEAIIYRLNHPDDATQVDVQVDDARVSRRYSSSTGQLTYLPDWWAWLGLDRVQERESFSIRPAYAPDAAWGGAVYGSEDSYHRRFR